MDAIKAWKMTRDALSADGGRLRPVLDRAFAKIEQTAKSGRTWCEFRPEFGDDATNYDECVNLLTRFLQSQHYQSYEKSHGLLVISW